MPSRPTSGRTSAEEFVDDVVEHADAVFETGPRTQPSI
jgi:hypothetical protein